MRSRPLAILFVLLAAAWPGFANAGRIIGATADPSVGTAPDGFNEVIGPEGYSPEHYDTFSFPPNGTTVCPTCTVPHPPPDRSAQRPPQH